MAPTTPRPTGDANGKGFDGNLALRERDSPEEVAKQRAEEESASESELVFETRVGAPSKPPKSFTSIEIKRLDDNIFIGEEAKLWRPPNARGIYGGQILGQALSAAMRTVSPDKKVHSLKGNFLRKGDATVPIVYVVDNLLDGTSFSARLVSAQQHGLRIFVMIASFQKQHVGRAITHQSRMPVVPPPEQLPTVEEYYQQLLADVRCPAHWRKYLEVRTRGRNPIDQRLAIVADFFASLGPPSPNRPQYPELATAPIQAVWFRVKDRLPDDPSMHAAVVAFASDMNLLGTARHETSPMDIAVIASLDHAMWFHAAFRADEWLLYFLQSPWAGEGRGEAIGMIFRADGTLCVSVGQEGVMRLRL